MNAFLEKIWGDDPGFRCLVATKKMSHSFNEQTGESLKDISRFVKQKKDVWYGVSLFGSKDRKKDNVVSTKAFFLDIDIKPDRPDCYADLVSGGSAVLEFAVKIGLPTPTLVRSGNGLHVYWILDKAITPDKWLPVARALQLACVEEGLLADGAITADIARILRVPDTKNYKDEAAPKPVEILTTIAEVTYEDIATPLADFIFRVELRDTADVQNAKFASTLPQTPKDAAVIADKCGQMSILRETRGNIPEPQWYAGLGVLALCIDGEAIAHDWSKGYAKYTEDETAAKFERAIEFAPTTCSKFYDTNPGICQKCPFYGKITTPLQLGETVTPIVIEPVEALVPHGTIADVVAGAKAVSTGIDHLIPWGYQCGKEGVIIPAKEDDESQTPQKISPVPLWVSRSMVTENRDAAEIEISWIPLRKTTVEKANLDAGLLSKPEALDTALVKLNIDVLDSKLLSRYIKSCRLHLNREQDASTIYDRFGLTDDESGFVVGTDLIQKDRRSPALISRRISTDRIKMLAEKGSLEGWTEATGYFDEPQYWMHRFTILAALGAPLFALAGIEGSVLSLAGESGGGKTTAAMVGVAAYSKPEGFTIDPQSTLKAFYENWRQAGNLPIIINEAATIRKDYLLLLMLAAANGKARDTSNPEHTIDSSGSWKTLTILTSNIHLLDLDHSILNEASKARMLELTFEPQNCIPMTLGAPIHAAIQKNHGIAGRLFLDFVMKNPVTVSQSIRDRVATLEKGIDSVRRYNVWLIATVSVVAEIATALGLIEFETADCVKNALGTLVTTVRATKTPTQLITELIAEYTSQMNMRLGEKEMTNDSAWYREPIGEAAGRYNLANNNCVELCLPIKMFNKYCLEYGIDRYHIKQFMSDSKAVEQAVRLTANGSVIRCYVIPHTRGEK